MILVVVEISSHLAKEYGEPVRGEVTRSMLSWQMKSFSTRHCQGSYHAFRSWLGRSRFMSMQGYGGGESELLAQLGLCHLEMKNKEMQQEHYKIGFEKDNIRNNPYPMHQADRYRPENQAQKS